MTPTISRGRSVRPRPCIASLSLPLDVLTFLVETSDSNARIGALYAIGALGTREALDYLLALSRTNKEDWSSILQNAEKLAARLNLFVARTSDGLALDETGKEHAVQ